MREDWFSTPVWFFNNKMTKLTKELILGDIDEYINKHTTASQSNRLGYQSGEVPYYHSSLKLFNTDILPSISIELKHDLNLDHIKLTSMWFNDNWEGAYNNTHVHPKSDLSGVWYINIPNPTTWRPDQCGIFTMYDPRPGAQLSGEEFQSTVKVEPEEGKIIIFPSWVPHSVGPNLTDERRISVSFNIKTMAYSG